MGVEIVEGDTTRDVRSNRLRFLTRCGSAWQSFLSRVSRLRRWSWPLAIAVALIYTACFASFINRHTSLPFYDGYVYVQKTSDLAANFHHASFFQRLNPAIYFGGNQPERPPLLLAIAAIVVGPDPAPASIAYVWLIIRVAIILLALYVLSREFGTARFVPAAALVTFASPLMCNFHRLYFMDEPFAAFGLLAFTLLLIDDRRQTFGSALAASAGILALFLVKPVALAFVFPLCVIRGARALLDLVGRGVPAEPQAAKVRRLLPWALPYLFLLAVMVALLNASPYGPAIRDQFKLGSTGYWHQEISPGGAFQLVSFVLPPWLLLTLLVVLPFSCAFQNKAVLLYLLGGFLWWLLFSFFLTYTIEDRLLGQAMPYVVTALLLWVCQRATITFLVTLVAAFFFLCNTLATIGRLTPGSIPKGMHFLSPVPQYQQPVREVGLLPFAQQLSSIVSEKPRAVYGVFSDQHVEPNSVNMALRITTQPPRPYVQWLPGSPREFDVTRFCRKRWFITKTQRRTSGYLNTGMWTTINSVHALITDPQSPLHSYFQKIFESPIQQPDLQDTLVLWQLRWPPPDAVIADALRWLKPRLTNDPPAFTAAVDSQLKTLSAIPSPQ